MKKTEAEFVSSLRKAGFPGSLCESINEIRKAVFESEEELENDRVQKLYCFSAEDFAKEMAKNGWVDAPPSNAACIEICSTPGNLSHEDSIHWPWFIEQNGSNILKIYFDDITEPILNIGRRGRFARGIDIDQARQIVEFIDRNIDKDFYIHCYAGKSRSQAVVQYILDTYGDRDWEIRPENPPKPELVNPRVLRMLKMASSR